MTKTKKTTPSPVPSREEFHREFAGFVSERDFESDERYGYRTYGYSYPTLTEYKNRKSRNKSQGGNK